MPPEGEAVVNGINLHATICVACCHDGTINWEEYATYKQLTPEKYRVQWSMNAPLPLKYLPFVTPLYAQQATHLSLVV
jgi:predicted transcriptional regulator